MVEMRGLKVSEGESATTVEFEEVQNLFNDYQFVFALPGGLPPKRNVDHRIQLAKGTNPDNVRPYK